MAKINAKIVTITSLYPIRFSGPSGVDTQSIPARHKSCNISSTKPFHNELIPSQEPDVVPEQNPSASLPLLPTSNNPQ